VVQATSTLTYTRDHINQCTRKQSEDPGYGTGCMYSQGVSPFRYGDASCMIEVLRLAATNNRGSKVHFAELADFA